jgi:fructokinase
MLIGIDLGGTKTEIICLHANNGKELYRQRVPSPVGSYEDTVRNIVQLVQAAEATIGASGSLGIGIPGTISSETGLVKNANSTWLNNHPLDRDLAKALGRDVRIQNDANCLAVSEAVDGSGQGKKTVFAVIIGTGSGAGVVVDGKPLSGLNGLGGEWGHNPLPLPKIYSAEAKDLESFFDQNHDPKNDIHPIYAHKDKIDYFVSDIKLSEFPGPQCYCGKRGCLERWISGPGFKDDHARVYGGNYTTHDLIDLFKKGDAQATASLNRYADRLARGLSTIINTIDPDIVVLGGGMSNITYLYEAVPQIWDKYVFSDRIGTPLVKAMHGDSSGVRGAAWLWSERA